METKLKSLALPIIIEGEYKQPLIDYILLMYDIDEKDERDEKDKKERPTEHSAVYFWTKMMDEQFHPNDYLKIEDQELELKWLFSTCFGMIEIADIFKTVVQLQGQKPFIFNPETIQLKKVIEDFRGENCLHQENSSNCKNRHYFIGVGKYTVDDITYDGVHIVLYPVQDAEQEKQTYGLADIKDPIYKKYLDWTKKHPDVTEDQVNNKKNELGILYINEFHKLLMKTPKFIKKEIEN